MSDESWFTHDHQPAGIPRGRRTGEVVWRLVDDGGHVQSCELHDDSRVGAGWDVMVLLDEEPSFSRRRPDAASARFYASAIEQDAARCGWKDQSRPEADR
jgi:hypothetical protein